MSDRNRDYIFNYADADPPHTVDRTTEYPSDEIIVMIRLNANNIPNDSLMTYMAEELRTKNMRLSRSSDNIVTISGYPPDNGFDQHAVLEIVQRYNRGAELVQER